MKRTVIGFLAFLLSASPVRAAYGDHLEPERGIFSPRYEGEAQYYEKVFKLLKNAFADETVVRMVNIPSFRPEYAVGIASKVRDSYSIFALEPSVQIMHRHSLRGVHVARCDLPIDATLGKRLVALWRAVLLQTHYDSPDEVIVGSDGETYHFSAGPDFLSMAGQLWFPPPDSTVAMLVAITDTMRNACKSKDERLLIRLEQEGAALEERLREER